MLRQVCQPAGAVFIAAYNVLSQRQVQERLREYIPVKIFRRHRHVWFQRKTYESVSYTHLTLPTTPYV